MIVQLRRLIVCSTSRHHYQWLVPGRCATLVDPDPATATATIGLGKIWLAWSQWRRWRSEHLIIVMGQALPLAHTAGTHLRHCNVL